MQTTLNKEFTIKGRGLHSGAVVQVRVLPADAGNGISMVRTDLAGQPSVQAIAANVCDTSRGTTIAHQGCTVATIEHLMAAFHAMRVDNARVEVDGGEIPILDGSSRIWVEAISATGLATLPVKRPKHRLAQPVRLQVGASTLVAEPSDHFSVEATIDFPNTPIGHQQAALTCLDEFETQVAPCRTFVMLSDIEPLLNLNLIKGGDLDNALVFVDKKTDMATIERLTTLFHRDAAKLVDKELINGPQLFDNEPARHKMLDFIGDISLAAHDIQAHFTINCPGHKANTAFAALVAQNMVCCD
ncbi:MAG: UDP-3-O-acyl-N-acetylglucosamine deacetylase [Bacteroidales bacterium]|nr:UDP-3-O-acyl-N-acetylglucosamine deacetylase [Bacteroidales bacterium]